MIIECKRNNTILNLKEGDVVAHVTLKSNGDVYEVLDEYVVKKNGLYALTNHDVHLIPDDEGNFTFYGAVFINANPITEEDIV